MKLFVMKYLGEMGRSDMGKKVSNPPPPDISLRPSPPPKISYREAFGIIYSEYFEECLRKKLLLRKGGGYENDITNKAWDVWCKTVRCETFRRSVPPMRFSMGLYGIMSFGWM